MVKRRSRRIPITREVTEEGFVYRVGKRRITKRAELKRIEALVIPPAWTEVEIAQSPSARVLARGMDAAGRTQAIYHPAFRRRQDRLKFERMLRFGRALPRLRAQVDRDLRRRRLSRSRVTACAIRLIDLQLFRVGNPEYAAGNASYGVTTLRQKHLTLGVTAIELDFVGKSGKRQSRRVRDPRAARIMAQLVEPPGQEVFRFFDEDGLVHNLRSSHVNAYVKKYMGEEFTAKDFRTWGGTVCVAGALLELGPEALGSEQARAAAVREAIALAAERLGNTVAVTRGSYVDPRVLAAVDHPRLLERVARARIRPGKWLEPAEQRAMRLIVELGRRRGK